MITDAVLADGLKRLSLLPGRESFLADPEQAAWLCDRYREYLGPYGDEAFAAAVDFAMRRERRFPPPAVLIDYAKEYLEARFETRQRETRARDSAQARQSWGEKRPELPAEILELLGR